MPEVSFTGLLIVAATQIGRELGLMTKATGAALIAAGLLSVLIFPVLALTLLLGSKTDERSVSMFRPE